MPTTEDRVGIVIPSYNSGAFVVEAAHSALTCLGGSDNVIVVDDGTSDRQSRAALRSLTQDGFEVVNQKNAGVSAARNHGLSMLSTPYAFVLDSDDLIEPGAATIAADILDSDDDVVIVSGAGIDFSDTTFADPVWAGPRTREDLRRWTLLATASAFRLRDWKATEGFPVGVATGEDWVFWLRLLRGGGSIFASESVFVRHRIHPGQTTQRYIDPRHAARAANLVMQENPDLILAHPDELLDEVSRLRMTLAEYRHSYRYADRAKARLKSLIRR